MHELEVLLSRLKMEHLSYHVESLLEEAAKKELNYREFLCMALQQEWNGRHQRGMCHERCNSDPHPTPEIRSRG